MFRAVPQQELSAETGIMPSSSPIVLDANAWLAVLLNEENSDWVREIIEKRPLFAPELIRYEAANGLLYAVRKRRLALPKPTLKELFEVIGDFPIQIIPVNTWWNESTRLVQEYSLTFYDASYVAVAIALEMPLLSLDEQILDVMKREKVTRD